MTSSDLLKPAPSWNADPLLTAKGKSSGYSRTQWDEKAAHSFGPWRLAGKPDPAQNQTTAAPIPTAGEPEDTAAAHHADLHTEEPHPMGEIVETVQAQLSESALNALREEAFQRGVAAGVAQARDELSQERHHERELFRHLSIELRSLNQDPQRFFEPLKRLSMHIAEQLVRAELQISGHVVNTLIQQCLEQFDHPADKAVVSLNPADLKRLQDMGSSVTEGLELEADPQLHVGSVRVRVNDTAVQDLIEHRLEPLARRLLNQPEAWVSRSALLNKEKIEVSEVNLPSRDWGRTAADIQDTEAKPLTHPTPKAEDGHDGL